MPPRGRLPVSAATGVGVGRAQLQRHKLFPGEFAYVVTQWPLERCSRSSGLACIV